MTEISFIFRCYANLAIITSDVVLIQVKVVVISYLPGHSSQYDRRQHTKEHQAF